jgi:hypothetical protein
VTSSKICGKLADDHNIQQACVHDSHINCERKEGGYYSAVHIIKKKTIVMDEVTGGWRKLHNEELHNLYSSPSIIRMINSRRMRWAGNVARMGEKRNAYRVLDIYHWEHQEIGGWLILRWI